MANEIQLVSRAQSEPLAFAEIYDHYFPDVYKYILYRVRDTQTADDLAAQTFERALRDIREYDAQRGMFGAWLFGITRNVVNHYFRRQKRFQWFSLDWLRFHPSGEPGPEESTTSHETTTRLLNALMQLDERERDLIALRFAAGLSNRQIAEMTRLTPSNVGVILYRAIQRLRMILNVEEKDEETSNRS
jgi:RNA polymerase sigma-70 factor (ECF subfamily)